MTPRRASGQGIVEYGLILGLASLLTLVALTLGSAAVSAFLEAVAGAIGGPS